MRSRPFVLLTASILLAYAVGVPLVNRNCEAAPAIEDDFGRDEVVETISVTIATGDDGQVVEETMALDLGLGFPLWLDPLGREPDEETPFGAVPDASDATATLSPGQSATFTFRAAAIGDRDRLRWTPALMDQVRVSDISRIGLLARGDSDWCLHRLEVTVNGKTLFAADDMDVHIQNEQALAQLRLDEVDDEIALMREDAEALAELVRSGLATEEEEQRLRDLDEVLVPQLQEQSRIERQLAGSYPWYLARDFQSPWRNGHDVQSMSVTLITAAHAGADTRNYVYYQTGGRKYLLTSPRNPLTSDLGPQVFSIDLIGGPATAGDLRGHSIGMLGHSEPFGDAPDRCHVQRMLVEVDGRVVYDSDENDIDRLSLEATRLISPAHFDEAGDIVIDTPVARETYVWKAGAGIGVDLVRGGAEALPPPTDPTWPPPEPGLEYDETLAADLAEDGFEEGFGPFPGEVYVETGFVADDLWAGDPWAGDPWAGDPWAGDPWAGDPWAGDPWGGDPWGGDPWGGDPWGWRPPASWLDVLVNVVFDRMGIDLAAVEEAIDEVIADPIGEPVQIDRVRLSLDHVGAFVPPPWTVRWDVTGDESDVESYLVEVFVFRPHSMDPVGAVVAESIAATGEREVAIDVDPDVMDAEIGADVQSAYLIARVCPILRSESAAGPGQFGPAIEAAIAVTGLGSMPIRVENPRYFFEESDGSHGLAMLAWGEPIIDGRAAWIPDSLVSHIGFAFAPSLFGRHIVFRPEPGDRLLTYTFGLGGLHAANKSIVLHAGFLGEAIEVGNTATVTVTALLESTVSPLTREDETDPVVIGPSTIDDPQAMRLIQLDVPPLEDGGVVEPAELRIRVRVEGGAADRDHPPVLVGLRAFRTP